MARGKSINLFLMDGDANGRMKCTLANWTGVAYKIPRTELDRCKERDDLKQSGVYFLFGKTEDTDEDVVYIGQAGARKNCSLNLPLHGGYGFCSPYAVSSLEAEIFLEIQYLQHLSSPKRFLARLLPL